MLHTRDTHTVEIKEILRAVSIFKTLEYQQLIKLFSKKEQTAKIIMRNLIQQNRIYHDSKTGIVADNQKSAENPDYSMIKAFWVFLEFNDKAEYYNIGDYPTLISFFANEEHYEVMYVAYDKEITFNFVLSKSGNGTKRLVIIDSHEQINKLKVPDLLCFCTVSKDGIVEFFKIS